jgi:hypothetical protein
MLKKLINKRLTQKVISVFLATAIIFSVLPTAIYSDDTLPEGTGTEEVTTDSGESEEASDSEIETNSSNEETENVEDDTTQQNEESTDTENTENDISITNDNSADITDDQETNAEGESSQESSEPEYVENALNEIQKISMTQTAADTVSATVTFTDDLPYASYYELFLDGVLVSVFNFQQEQKVVNLTAGKKYIVQIKGYDGAGNVLADSGNYDVYTSIDSYYVINEDVTVYSANLSRGLNLNGNSLTVLNDLLFTGGTLNIGGGSLYVKGDFNYHNGSSVSTGYLQMQNAVDYVLVDGDFNVLNYNDIESYMTAGTLEIKGDFTQTNNYYVFQPSGSHKTIFSGNNEQTITLPNHSSRFNILELKNTSGVIFGTEVQYNELIQNETTITYETTDPIVYDWILEKDETIDGDYTILSENVDLNGHTFTINGDLIQAGGILKINGGKLNISGDYRMQNELSGYDYQSNGLLDMTNDADYVTVGGNYISYSSVSHEGFMTAGTLEVKGDLRYYSGNSRNIYSSGTHTIILSGNRTQRLDINYSSQLNNLKIHSNSKRYIDNDYSTLKIAGELEIDENSLLTYPDDIDFLPSAKLNTPVWNSNLNLDYPIEIMQDMKIDGYVYIYNNNSAIRKWTLSHDIETKGYFYFNNSGIDVEIIEANIISGEYINIYCKDFKSNSDITAKRNISISVSGEVCISDGNIKTSEYLSLSNSSSASKEFKLSGNIEATNAISISTYNADAIIDANLSSDSNISVSGNNVILSGGEIKSQDYISLNGTNIEVNTKNVSAKSYITTSGTRTLIGSENLTGELRLGSTETVLTADVAINGNAIINSGILNPYGNKLSVSGNLTSQNGRLQMQNADDYILISGDFNSGYSTTEGQTTAGVLEIKGNFVQDYTNYSFTASGTHKTIFSGVETQTVTLKSINSSLNIIEITNTSEGGVVFATTVRYSELIDENNKAHFNEAVESVRTLKTNETINGDLSLAEGELNLAGFTLTVNGDLIQSGGIINIGSGKLVVNGDYRVETPNEDGSFSQSKGILKMSDETGLVDVSGGFIYNSVYSAYSYVTNGTFQVGGNVNLQTLVFTAL